MSDNNEDADYWYDRGYEQALIDAEQKYYTSDDQSEEYSDSDSSEDSEDSDSSPPRPPSPPPRPPSPRRQTDDKYEDEDKDKPKYKYKYKYKHDKRSDDKDKTGDDKDKTSDDTVKVNAVKTVVYYDTDTTEDELEELHPSQRHMMWYVLSQFALF